LGLPAPVGLLPVLVVLVNLVVVPVGLVVQHPVVPLREEVKHIGSVVVEDFLLLQQKHR